MTYPAGWYADPGNPSCVRWWDGTAWTGHTQASVPTAPSVDGPRTSGVEAVDRRPELQREVEALKSELEALRRDVVETREVMALQEVGIYRYSHPLETALAFKDRLAEIESSIRDAVKKGDAVVGTKQWAINGSQKEGTRMVSDFCKLMLRAYNNEADDAVRVLKPFMLESAIKRLEKARATIQKLGSAMHIEVTESFHRLRVAELRLTADFLAKREEEREREREARARMKEEEAVRRELEREKERLEKERSHYEAVVAAMTKNGDAAAVAKAERKLAEIDGAITGVENREANTRAGYVYCISNIGAFGPGVVKIGLTRRLDPMDRVRELGDASVPFRFDVHALIFSDDAVDLETRLHRRFAEMRVNRVNAHREFFYVTPADVKAALEAEAALIQFQEVPEALEWRQSETERAAARSE